MRQALARWAEVAGLLYGDDMDRAAQEIANDPKGAAKFYKDAARLRAWRCGGYSTLSRTAPVSTTATSPSSMIGKRAPPAIAASRGTATGSAGAARKRRLRSNAQDG